MGTMSYYTLVSMSLNVDQYPLPEGAGRQRYGQLGRADHPKNACSY